MPVTKMDICNMNWCLCACTVPLKSKLTLETQTSRLDPQASMFEMFEDRETRLSRICKNLKWFRENDLFLEGRIVLL